MSAERAPPAVVASARVVRLADAQERALIGWREIAPPVKPEPSPAALAAAEAAVAEIAGTPAARGMSSGAIVSILAHAALVGYGLAYLSAQQLPPDLPTVTVSVEMVDEIPTPAAIAAGKVEDADDVAIAAADVEADVTAADVDVAAEIADSDLAAAAVDDAEAGTAVAAVDVSGIDDAEPVAVAMADDASVAPADDASLADAAPVVVAAAEDAAPVAVAVEDVAPVAVAIAATEVAIAPTEVAMATTESEVIAAEAALASAPAGSPDDVAVRPAVEDTPGGGSSGASRVVPTVPLAGDALAPLAAEALTPMVEAVDAARISDDDLVVAAVDVEPEPEVAEVVPKPAAKPAAKPVEKPAAKPRKPAAAAPAGAATPRSAAETDNLAAAYAGTLAKQLAAKGKLPPAQPGFRRSAVVVFTIDAAGNVFSIQILNSTGSAYMDQQVMTAVRKASPFPPIPQELATDSFIVRAPMQFPK